ncbi:hypothetical protein HDV00_012647 [Rhizophlyctis rosea]|nr:hypothetical protein HDV00_012647 [Rhizophlyctis rosea]
MHPAFTLPTQTTLNRPLDSFNLQPNVVADRLIPQHHFLPLTHPLQADLNLHQALHAYYDPFIFNAGYFAEAYPDEVDVDEDGNPIEGEPTLEVVVIILVSTLAQLRDGEMLRWRGHDGEECEMRICFGMGTRKDWLGVLRDGEELRGGYEPVRPGSSISVKRFADSEATLSCFVDFRMLTGKPDHESTEWQRGFLTSAQNIAFCPEDQSTKVDIEDLRPTISATNTITQFTPAPYFHDHGDILSPSTLAQIDLEKYNKHQTVDRSLGRIITAAYCHYNNHTINTALCLFTRPTTPLNTTSNSAPVKRRHMYAEERAKHGNDINKTVGIPLHNSPHTITDHAGGDMELFRAGIASGVSQENLGIIQELTWPNHTSREWVLRSR